MEKAGNQMEVFSELFIYHLGRSLGLPMAEYYRTERGVRTPDFTYGTRLIFEDIRGLVREPEDYQENFSLIWDLSPDMARQYLEIIYMDALCRGVDRHVRNYGFLRDPESGRLVSMAPNFDNNIALFYLGVPKDLSRRGDPPLVRFCELLRLDSRAAELAASLPAPTTWQITQAVKDGGSTVSETTVITFVMGACEYIQEQLQKFKKQ